MKQKISKKYSRPRGMRHNSDQAIVVDHGLDNGISALTDGHYVDRMHITDISRRVEQTGAQCARQLRPMLDWKILEVKQKFFETGVS